MADVHATYPPVRTATPDDPYQNRRQELDSPASYAFPVTPSQGELPTTIRALYIGTTGNVFCKMAGGNSTHATTNVFFMNVVAGTILPIRMDGVFTYNTESHPGAAGTITATGGNSAQNTTATFLVGLY